MIPADDYEEDWSILKADYIRLLGDDLTFRPWVAPGALSGFDLILPLIAWGYQRDCPTWFALLDRLGAESLPVANPTRVLRWNSDKQYLMELKQYGVPVVPTRLATALTPQDLAEARAAFRCERLVVKPPISGGADGTHLLGINDAIPASVAGQKMMVQPFLPAIAGEGEYSLFYFAGHYSHAIVKHPADGDFRVQEQFGGGEQGFAATDDAKALAQAAMAGAAAVTGTDNLTYARVDMVRSSNGALQLMELELIEPSLFLQHASDGGTAFAQSILAAARRS